MLMLQEELSEMTGNMIDRQLETPDWLGVGFSHHLQRLEFLLSAIRVCGEFKILRKSVLISSLTHL